jgi:signal transduction histidine kinase
MAWITSATDGGGLAKRHSWSPKGMLLLAHLVLLMILIHDRTAADASVELRRPVTDLLPATLDSVGGPGALALCTGLLLAFSLFVGNRPKAALQGSQHLRQNARVLSLPALALHAEDALSDAQAGLMARLNHDLRTPLNAMLGFADLMHAETFGPLGHERYRTYVSHMQTCGRDLLRATESTLAMAELLSSPGLTGTQAIDLADLVGSAWHTVATASRRPAPELHVRMAPDISVRGDVQALGQSLVNLFEAALMRAGPNGQLEFGANCSYGRVQAWISVTGRSGRPVAATTGCRPASSACGAIDDLPISVSRKLLGLQGVPMVVATDQPDKWTVTLSLEDAAQSDFFADQSGPTAARRATVAAAGSN